VRQDPTGVVELEPVLEHAGDCTLDLRLAEPKLGAVKRDLVFNLRVGAPRPSVLVLRVRGMLLHHEL
jgi:hypothetical protein